MPATKRSTANRRAISMDGASLALVRKIGAFISKRRDGMALSQQLFAERFGFSLMTLRRLESGERPATLDTLILAARACQLSITELMAVAELPEEAPTPAQPQEAQA